MLDTYERDRFLRKCISQMCAILPVRSTTSKWCFPFLSLSLLLFFFFFFDLFFPVSQPPFFSLNIQPTLSPLHYSVNTLSLLFNIHKTLSLLKFPSDPLSSLKYSPKPSLLITTRSTPFLLFNIRSTPSLLFNAQSIPFFLFFSFSYAVKPSLSISSLLFFSWFNRSMKVVTTWVTSRKCLLDCASGCDCWTTPASKTRAIIAGHNDA